MMDNDLEAVESNNADTAIDEDQTFDTLEDAVEALADDDLDEEQPTDEAETEEEADETDEDEAEQSDDEATEEDSEPEGVFELPDGNEITLSEIADLQANGLRAKDYTHKTTELAQQREALKVDRQAVSERANSLNQLSQNLGKYLESIIPAEPSLQLAQSDPARFQYEKALRESAIAELSQVKQFQQSANEQVSALSQEDITRLKEQENGKLIEAMPHLSDPVKRKAFDDVNSKAAKEFGFSEDEISQTFDHRILRMAYYAEKGLRSEHNIKNARKRVQTPTKAKPSRSVQNNGSRKNAEAMRKLSKSGSLEDALKIDFD